MSSELSFCGPVFDGSTRFVAGEWPRRQYNFFTVILDCERIHHSGTMFLYLS